MIFDIKMIEHISQSIISEGRNIPYILIIAHKIFSSKRLVIILSFIESVLSFMLTIPIPIYSSFIYSWITHSPGLPNIGGMYLRALYYKKKLGYMSSNVFIDQGVFFAHPKNIHLQEFSYIDKNVIIMAREAKIGRRVHIATNVFISGGGDFEIHDYAGIAPGSCIITSSEIIKNGYRCSGPMTSPDQRNVLRGKVIIEKDSFIGAAVTILPNVVVEVGSVIGAGSTVTNSTEPWGIYAGEKIRKIAQREPVIYPEN